MVSNTRLADEDLLRQEIEELCATARQCYGRGWVPATSGNFSVRLGTEVFITASGLDKGRLTPGDLLELGMDGAVLGGSGSPSAETSLHLVIYRERENARAILHVHSVWNTLLSGRLEGDGFVMLRGYELLKGLAGVTTHEHEERVPIIANTQEYVLLAEKLKSVLWENDEAHGILLIRHGLYTWGESVAEARRHLEALEFLFEVEGRRVFGK
jgi:methylthioribulose-1-phosphate dehydratase